MDDMPVDLPVRYTRRSKKALQVKQLQAHIKEIEELLDMARNRAKRAEDRLMKAKAAIKWWKDQAFECAIQRKKLLIFVHAIVDAGCEVVKVPKQLMDGPSDAELDKIMKIGGD